MSSYDDDIEFDFFDEPETEEATQRRRLPRIERPGSGGRPPRGPMRPAPGLIPLARLAGLILFAILIVLALVVWVQSCQGASKRSRYESYMAEVSTLAQSSEQIGTDFSERLAAPGIKQQQLVSALDDFARREATAVARAQSLKPPGPLRSEHAYMVDALRLRATGLAGLSAALAQAKGKNSSSGGVVLAQQAQLLTASDVDWDVFFRGPSLRELERQGVQGVRVPHSTFVKNPELVTARSLQPVLERIRGATTGGTPSAGGKHGDALVSVVATSNSSSVTLSTSTSNTIRASTNLTFAVTVEDSGDSVETGVPVTLNIGDGTIVRRQTVDVINPGEHQVVKFPNVDVGSKLFGARTTVKVDVGAVPNEANTQNNSATYQVFFSL